MRVFTKLASALMILLFATSTVFSQSANSVFNQRMDEYLQNREKEKMVELTENSKAPNYKKVTLDLKGKGEAYAYVAYDPSSTLPQGPASFDTDDPSTLASIAPTTSADFIAAGTWADGVWYGEEYGTGNLYTIDEGDGTMTLVGSGGIGFNGMAYDGSTMYACTSTELYSVDLSTGTSTLIGSMGNGGGVMIAMACDGSTLYGFDLGDDNLYDIDMSSGAATLIGSLGIDMNYAQDAEYDKDNSVLYLAGYTTTGELYTVNPSTAAATLVGGFANGCEICGFAIPYTGITFPNDVGIMSITEPASGGDLGNAEAVTVKIKNYGDNPQSNFDVYFTMDGGAQNIETISSTIEPGETLLHTFATTVDLSEYGFYDFTACTMLANDDNTDNDCKDKTVENYAPSYCDATTGTEDEIIGHVVCGDIDNTSGWQGGVADYTDQSTAIDAGGSVDITVTNTGGLYASDITYVWVDWNDDFVFEQGGDEEFQLENVGGTGETFTGTVTVPASATEGLHRMRVRMTYSSAPEPCGDASWGEVEDYSIVVGGGGGNAIFADDFDAYNAGEQVACQNPEDWTTWSNAPCGSEDAYVSDAFAYSGDNSANVVTDNDLVYELDDYYTSGAYSVGMMVYIPSGFDGYYNVLSDFGGGASPEWGFEVYFNVGGDGSVNAGATGAATFTFPFDTWMLSEVVVDLDNDMAQYYLDGNMIVEWAWTAGAAGGGAQLQLAAVDFFGATATTSFYFDDFMIENISAPPVLDPPTDLNGSVDGNDVTLTWTAPGGGTGNGDPQWIQWDSGENTGNGIGLTNGGTFMVASRWMPDELTDFDGMGVTQLSFFANGDPGATYVMKIWTGDAAGTEVMSQDVATFTVDDFNIVDLTSPVTIDASMQYWFGYEVTHGAGTFPAGADDGPAVQESGDMISLDGVDWVGMSAAYGLDYNWNIAIYVDNLKNAAPAQAIVKSTIPAATATLANSGALSGKLNVFSPNATKALIGYNVYRDGSMIGSTTETTYDDMDLPVGTYEYYVTALYDEGESDPTNTYTAVIEETPPGECEGFDDLNVGDYVALELGGLWTTWSDAPGTAEDATVSDAYSLSPSNSALVEGTTDLVLLAATENLTSGVHSFNNDIYIPTGTTGYWNLQKDVVAGTEWGFQIMYEDDMTMIIDAGAAAAAVIPYSYDTWYHNEVVVDLDNDLCQFYIDGELIIEYQWTLGLFGTEGALTLGGANMFANPGATGTPPGAHFDNVCFTISEPPPPLPAPTNLTGPASVTQGNDINLTWDAPGGGEWIHWDSGENTGNGIGLTNGGTFMVAMRWMPDELAPYNGMSVSQLSFFANGDPGATYVMKIWTGDAAGTEVMSQDVAVFTVDDFNIIDLDNPVTIDASMQYWFGYELTHSAGTFPAGADDGPAVQESGDMISLDGVDWVGMSAAYGLDYNWNIQAYVGLGDKAATSMAKPATKIANSGTVASASQNGVASGVKNFFAPENTKALTGYNVYRDGTVIATTTDTEYTDNISNTGQYTYCVTAVYDEGESDCSNDWVVDVTTGINENLFNNTEVYPNPASSVVNVKSEMEITNVKVYNSTGQLVSDEQVNSKLYQINTSQFEAGLYFFQIESNDAVISKRIIIQ